MYIYTAASLLLNPLTALILCFVGYVSATPMAFVSGSNAIRALNKKIDMLFKKMVILFYTR